MARITRRAKAVNHAATHAAYREQVANLRESGALKREGSTWAQLTGGNYIRPSIDDEELATPTGFARFHGRVAQ